MTVPRVVLDTDVLVSALLFPASRIFWLREAWRSGVVVPLASGDTSRAMRRMDASSRRSVGERRHHS